MRGRRHTGAFTLVFGAIALVLMMPISAEQNLSSNSSEHNDSSSSSLQDSITIAKGPIGDTSSIDAKIKKVVPPSKTTSHDTDLKEEAEDHGGSIPGWIANDNNQGDFTITIGQNKTFTSFNYKDYWLDHDPGFSLPYPVDDHYFIGDNIVGVSLSASSNQDGNANGALGLDLVQNLGEYSFDQVKNWPVDITVSYSYDLSASSVAPGEGSTHAWICVLSPPYHMLNAYPGSTSGQDDRTIKTTVGAMGGKFRIEAFCQAHTVEDSKAIHESSARLELKSIKYEFAELKLNICNCYIDEPNTPLVCLGNPVFIYCQIKDSLDNIIQADEVTADIIRPDRSKKTIVLTPYPQKNCYRGEYQTDPGVADDLSDYERAVGKYKVVIHANKNGYVPGSSGELEFEVEPTKLTGTVYDVQMDSKGVHLPKIAPASMPDVFIKPTNGNGFHVKGDPQGRFLAILKPDWYRISASSGGKVTIHYPEQAVYVPCSGKDVVIPAYIVQVQKAIEDAKWRAKLDYKQLELMYYENAEGEHKFDDLKIQAIAFDDLLTLRTLILILGLAEENPYVALTVTLGEIVINTGIETFTQTNCKKLQKAIMDMVDATYNIYMDPADPNYTEIYQIKLQEPLVLPPGSTDSMNRSFAKYTDAFANQSAIDNALIESFERYQGALNSGETEYVPRQAQAIIYYARMSQNNSAELVSSIGVVKSELESARLKIEPKLTALQENLSSRSYTPEELEELKSHNFTDQDINVTKHILVTLNFSDAIDSLDVLKAVALHRAEMASNLSNQSSQMLALITEPNGCYIGAYLGGDPNSLSCESSPSFNKRMIKPHAIFTKYVPINDSQNPAYLDWANNEVIKYGAMPMFIYNPLNGLDDINMSDVERFAANCSELDVPVFLVFGSDMNAPWNPGGNQPDKYKAKFKEVAETFHRIAPNVRMCWVPRHNYGYPWGGVDYGDGYSEYYPDGIGLYGDYIDWVGLNLYDTDWDESNSIPQGFFLTAIKNGQKNIDFYETFAVGKDKPMMIASTSAFDPNKDPTELGVRNPLDDSEQTAYKNSWISQVYNAPILKNDMPTLHAICYSSVNSIGPYGSQNHDFGNIAADFRIPEGLYSSLISDLYFIGASQPATYFPDFIDTADLNSWRSTLVLQNPYEFVNNATIEIRSRDGELLYFGSNMIPAQSTNYLRPRDLIGSDCSGSAIITSEQPIMGICRFERNDNGMTISYNAFKQGSTMLSYPDFTDTTDSNNIRLWLILQNPANVAASTSLEIRSRIGDLLYSGINIIPARCTIAVRPGTLVGSDCSGSIRVVSNQSIAGLCQVGKNDNPIYMSYSVME